MFGKAEALMAKDSATYAEMQETMTTLATCILNGNQDAASTASFRLVELAIQLYGQVVDWRPAPRCLYPCLVAA